MLPNTQNAPAELPQLARHPPVTHFVGRKLFQPERPVVYGHGRVLRAAMPEAAVHEDDNALLAEGEIRSAKKRRVSAPAGDARCVQQFCQREFSRLVAAPENSGHHLGAFGFGEDVRHRGSVPTSRGEHLHKSP